MPVNSSVRLSNTIAGRANWKSKPQELNASGKLHLTFRKDTAEHLLVTVHASGTQSTLGISVQQHLLARPVTSEPSASWITTPATMSATGTKKIYVIFYTTYGHIHKMVEEVVKGINSVSGVEAVLLQVCDASRIMQRILFHARAADELAGM